MERRIEGEFRLKIPNFEGKKDFDFNGLKINVDNSKAHLELPLPPEIDKPCRVEVEYLLEENFEKLANALAFAGIGLVGDLVSFRGTTGVCVKIKVIESIKIDEQKIKEAKKYLSFLDRLDADLREVVMKALKWWREGFVENDSVDKFLKFFISFEIIAKNVVGEEQWIKKILSELNLDPKMFVYENKQINKIRSGILHGGSEENVELAKKYAERFGKDVLIIIRKIIKKYAGEN